MSFKPVTQFDACTSLKGYIEANYQKLVQILGEPLEGDGYKVSGEWYIEADNGAVVTLYDWKSTDLYDCDYPTVEEFRQQPSAIFNIGGNDQYTAQLFKEWLEEQLKVS